MRSDTEERTTDLRAEDTTEVNDTDIATPSTTTESANANEPDDIETAGDLAEPDEQPKPKTSGRRVSFSIRTLVVGTVIAALVAAVGVTTWLYIDTRTHLDHQTRLDADFRHAEEVALNYAVNAAIMDCRDLGPWKQNLVKGTTPELSDKLTKAATAMEQILLPLQWSSTAKPLAAKVRSHDNGVYVVDAFVSVMTKTVQATDSLQSTATYSVTVDSNNAWKISDVGGIAAVVADK